ncbi:MAG: hypothetical protein H2055_00975 [Sphingopyxis sp.]|nr:hypothetical protein [Sphingopyxis sp.]
MADLLEPFAGRDSPLAANRLIAHFGSLGRALAATPEQLSEALGDDRKLAKSILAARRLVHAGLREEVQRSPVSPLDPAFRSYLSLILGNATTERLHATFVTHEWGYLADEILAEGTTGHVEGDLRRLLSRAFDLGAHGIILAHNHPSGSAEPSDNDVALTRRIAPLANSVGIQILDHLIVGASRIISMRERELL